MSTEIFCTSKYWAFQTLCWLSFNEHSFSLYNIPQHLELEFLVRLQYLGEYNCYLRRIYCQDKYQIKERNERNGKSSEENAFCCLFSAVCWIMFLDNVLYQALQDLLLQNIFWCWDLYFRRSAPSRISTITQNILTFRSNMFVLIIHHSGDTYWEWICAGAGALSHCSSSLCPHPYLINYFCHLLKYFLLTDHCDQGDHGVGGAVVTITLVCISPGPSVLRCSDHQHCPPVHMFTTHRSLHTQQYCSIFLWPGEWDLIIELQWMISLIVVISAIMKICECESVKVKNIPETW